MGGKENGSKEISEDIMTKNFFLIGEKNQTSESRIIVTPKEDKQTKKPHLCTPDSQC